MYGNLLFYQLNFQENEARLIQFSQMEFRYRVPFYDLGNSGTIDIFPKAIWGGRGD